MARLSTVVTDQEYSRIQKLVRAGAADSVAELVRFAVRDYIAKSGAIRLLNLREVSVQEARRAVERYLKSHPGIVWPDEMAENLGLDYRVVLKVLQDLQGEGKIEEAAIREETTET